MNTQRMISLGCMCLFAFAGGMAAQYGSKLIISPSYAEGNPPKSIVDSDQQYLDKDGKVRLKIGMGQGAPEESIWGEDGKPRIVLGTSPETADGKGLPSIKLYDNQGRLKLVLRIAEGKNQSPVLEMKDNQSRNRIIMGLAAQEPGEDPFLVYIDKDGGKHSVFGSF